MQSSRQAPCMYVLFSQQSVISTEPVDKDNTSENVNPVVQDGDKRYLLCPGGMSIGHLKKFLRLKFDLLPKYEVSRCNFKRHEGLWHDHSTV